ncbi:MAG: delta-60 repeat domain-containing protein [Piscinibacter sp.]
MKTTPIAQAAALLILATTLAACGGGGSTPSSGGNEPPPTENPPPADNGDFSLLLSTDKALVIQGHTVQLTATLTRRNGFSGAVQVALQNLPAGASAASVVIAEGATSARITLSAAASAPHSLPTAVRALGSAGTKTASAPLTVTVGGLPGAIDTSFQGGAQFVSPGEGEDYAAALAVQPDGKVLSVGWTSTAAGGTDLALVRHGRDGVLDAGFGSGGKVVTGFAASGGADQAYAVALQRDGKILVGGSTATSGTDLDFLLVRYHADGRLDTSFGQGGKVVTSFGTSTDRINAILVQDDGKIVVGGESDQGSTTTGIDFALARYNTDGSLDAGFGNAGKVLTPVRSQSARDSIYAMTWQQVGNQKRIVAVGGEGDFAAVRYLADGQLDGGFGSGGKVGALFGSTIGAARAVLATPQGQLVLAGSSMNDVALARLNADGTLDAGFGTGGRVITALAADNWDAATALVRQADGKLIVGGWVYEGAGSAGNFALLRYSGDGAADATFGSAGRVVTPVAAPMQRDAGRALALQADDRISTVRVLQAGEASKDGGYQFALLRYWL